MTETSSAAAPRPVGGLTLVARDVHVRYRVPLDNTRSLRRLVARGFRSAGHREVHAVRGVDLELREGESLGVIGRNGSGKSTLLRALAGLVPPTSGSVRARSSPILLGVNAVLQMELSCRRNVQLGTTALGMDRREGLRRADEILRFAGVEDFAELPFRTLSSGMRARLQFAIASSVTPDILMIDETLAVGDADFRAKSEKRIRELRETAGSVVLVSHSMNLMKSACSRMVWLDAGQVMAEGDPDQVVGEYQKAAVRS